MEKILRRSEESFEPNLQNILKSIIPLGYIAPTWVREKNMDTQENPFGLGEYFAIWGATIHCAAYLSFGGDIINKIFNLDDSNLIHLPLALFPLFTNSISKIYEIFRDRKYTT